MVLEMAADAMGDRIAIGNLDDGLRYADLRRAARAVAQRIEQSGGATTLALMEPLAPIVPAALFGAAWAGISYAPLNYRLPDDQLDALLARVQPALVAAPNWVDPEGAPERDFPAAPEAPAVLLFTSGTSAAPKAAV